LAPPAIADLAGLWTGRPARYFRIKPTCLGTTSFDNQTLGYGRPVNRTTSVFADR
jgi:hypothetical protein